MGHAYAKTEIAVFHECKALHGIDPTSFNVFESRPSYGRDDKFVVLDGSPILGADPASFEVIAPFVDHARDSKHVYYRGKLIPRADPKTIKQISGYYFRDQRAVYAEGQEIVGADMSTVSKHLTLMREAGVLVSEKRGLNIYYQLACPCFADFFRCVDLMAQPGRTAAKTTARKKCC